MTQFYQGYGNFWRHGILDGMEENFFNSVVIGEGNHRGYKGGEQTIFYSTSSNLKIKSSKRKQVAQ